jgi:hypothetical protein
MKRMTPKERAATVKIIQNVCSLIAEIGTAIKNGTKPGTKSYAEALVDGIDEAATASEEADDAR